MFRTVVCVVHLNCLVCLQCGHGIRFQEDTLDVEKGQPRGINIDYGGMSDSYFG